MKCCYNIKWKSAKKLDHHLTAFKVWKCACTLHRQRKANLHLLNSYCLKSHSAIDMQNNTHFTYCRMKHWMLILSLYESICLLQYFMDSQLSSKCTLLQMEAQAMKSSAVSDHTWSEQGPGLCDPQNPLPATVFCDAPEHAAECMFEHLHKDTDFLYSDTTK